MKKEFGKTAYILLFLAVCLVPLVFMPWFGNQKAESNSSLVALPKIKTASGEINKDYLDQLGEYFSKKFAFRQQLVDANAHVRSILETSAQDNVVIGKDGWLFYESSMDEYLGRNTMSDYEVKAAASNLALMQDQLEKEGIDFLFTISPNKNSLYPEYMPGKYKPDTAKRNAGRLIAEMEKEEIDYVDLFALFEEQKEILYHKTDSHWNNMGAAMVADALLEAAYKDHESFVPGACTERNDFQGDLFKMLYPRSRDKEREIEFDRKFTYEYVSDIESTEDIMIETKNDAKTGNLLMLRDSFGNSLLPFVAEEYGSAYFCWTLPYKLELARERYSDTVIFELVERNLENLVDDAPELLGISEKVSTKSAKSVKVYNGKCEWEYPQESMYLRLYGKLDPEKTGGSDEVYVVLSGERTYVYPVYRTRTKSGDENGFAVYVDPETIEKGVYDMSLMYGRDEEYYLTDKLGVMEGRK